MAKVTRSSLIQSGALAAATPVNVDMDVAGSSRVSVLITNTGANPIGTVAVGKSANGLAYGTDAALGTAIGSIAAGATSLVELVDTAFVKLRLTLTSALGSSYSVEMRGTD